MPVAPLSVPALIADANSTAMLRLDLEVPVGSPVSGSTLDLVVRLENAMVGVVTHQPVTAVHPVPAITLDQTFQTQECERPLSVIARQDSATVTWGTTLMGMAGVLVLIL